MFIPELAQNRSSGWFVLEKRNMKSLWFDRSSKFNNLVSDKKDINQILFTARVLTTDYAFIHLTTMNGKSNEKQQTNKKFMITNYLSTDKMGSRGN